MKISTAFHFHLTDPVKSSVWMSANHNYTAGCIWWPSSIAKYARASCVEHLLAGHREGRVPGVAGAPLPTSLDLVLLWASGILFLFGSPQVEGEFFCPVRFPCNSQPVSLCRKMFGKVLPLSSSVSLTPLCCHDNLEKPHVFIFMWVRVRWLKVLVSHVKNIIQQNLQPCAFKKQTCFTTNFNWYPKAQKLQIIVRQQQEPQKLLFPDPTAVFPRIITFFDKRDFGSCIEITSF